MRRLFSLLLLLWAPLSLATTIAIIDTGFDLDHDFLKPKILKQETDEETINPSLKEFSDWQFHDNSHLKKSVIQDESLLQEVLLYRNLRAKGHREGLSLSEFQWFKKRSADKEFMNQVKNFKKHSHGTFVAGIALREGENISIFPIRGLHIPIPVVAVDEKSEIPAPLKSRTPETKFKEEIKNSQDRVIRKFSKICRYLSINGINIINASYGITYKNTISKFRERYFELTGKEISELQLQEEVKEYFNNLFGRSAKVIRKYPRILFVFSAGNSGLDNDVYPHYPSKIKLPNTLSVGAMNGDYLASFSNFGKVHVDIGAPGVAILSLVPKVYSENGKDMYSPASGTSMAAPYISNLAAQILNMNPKLAPQDIKKIILETGDEKEHLKSILVSGAIANNQNALKAALLSKYMDLEASINLAKSGLIPMEDSVSIGQPPAIGPDQLKTKVLDSLPMDISPQEIEEIEDPTTEESSLLPNSATNKPDNSVRPSLSPEVAPAKSSDPTPASQSEVQSPPPSVEPRSSSSLDSPPLPPVPAPATEPSLP